MICFWKINDVACNYAFYVLRCGEEELRMNFQLMRSSAVKWRSITSHSSYGVSKSELCRYRSSMSRSSLTIRSHSQLNAVSLRFSSNSSYIFLFFWSIWITMTNTSFIESHHIWLYQMYWDFRLVGRFSSKETWQCYQIMAIESGIV
jgi:hypothetical protein